MDCYITIRVSSDTFNVSSLDNYSLGERIEIAHIILCTNIRRTFGEMMSNPVFSIILLSITIHTSADQVVYIIPEFSSGGQQACPKHPCHNLTYYTLLSTIINSNTVLQFMAGIHTMKLWVEIDFVTNVTLRGTATDATIIRCTGNACLRSWKCNNLGVSICI